MLDKQTFCQKTFSSTKHFIGCTILLKV